MGIRGAKAVIRMSTDDRVEVDAEIVEAPITDPEDVAGNVDPSTLRCSPSNGRAGMLAGIATVVVTLEEFKPLGNDMDGVVDEDDEDAEADTVFPLDSAEAA